LTWTTAEGLFQEEGARILALWDTLPPERLTERVLIRRFPGIEDSSRYWSAAMTVEHLNIVGTGIRHAIAVLRRGEVPTGPARIEDVKPKGEVEPTTVRAEFVQLLADFASVKEPPIPRGEGPRYTHPWFGLMDAYQWHCLVCVHQGLHRKQIEAIRVGLGVS